MVFVSNTFIFLFLPIFLLVYLATPSSYRNLCILIFSWIFYAWWRIDLLPLLILITAWSWLTGLWIERAKEPYNRISLLVAVIGPLAALGWFKYANLFVEGAEWMGYWPSYWQPVILPIGLSFFVFGAISYSVDVYRRTVSAEPSFTNYAAYQSMFGHLIAGPIVRYQSVAARLKFRIFNWSEFNLGVERFMIGFSQKVLLADTLAPLVDAGYSLNNPTSADVAITLIAYTLQLYFDFVGYSHMAIGLGLMVGLRFPENFRNPYLSTSLTEFWRRWHISLSSWLRDYLYIPLGGNRGSRARVTANLLVTMALGGMWHGASWTFLVWGLWHGVGLVIVRLWRGLSKSTLPNWLGHLLTLLFVILGWGLFRAPDWTSVGSLAEGLAGLNGWKVSDAFSVSIRPIEILTLVLGVGVIYSPLLARQNVTTKEVYSGLARWSLLPLWLFALWVLQGRAVVPFLYFQF